MLFPLISQITSEKHLLNPPESICNTILTTFYLLLPSNEFKKEICQRKFYHYERIGITKRYQYLK